MKIIKELCPKPSMAIRKAIEGITNLSQDPLFEVDMGDFGSVSEKEKGVFICAGCLATATIMNIGDISPESFINAVKDDSDSYNKLRKYFNLFDLSAREVDEFEDAIDSLRYGQIQYLFDFYGLSMTNEVSKIEDKHLDVLFIDTDNWQKHLPKLEEMASDLEKLGH